MSKFAKLLDAICATVAGLCMVGMIALNFADSIGRQISHPVLGAQEMVAFLLVIFFFASIPILVRENAHIRVGLFVDIFPKRLRSIEGAVSAALELVGTGLLIWLIFDRAIRLKMVGSVSAQYKLELWYFVLAGAILLGCSIVFLIERVLSHRARSARPGEPEDAHHIRHDEDAT